MPEAAPGWAAAVRPGGAVFLRDAELGLLRGWLALAGESAQVVRVSGEPGAGKSHLLRRLMRSARREGWTVAAGRIPRGGGRRPLEVVVDALDDVLARADGSLFEELGADAAGRLAAVFPALHGPGTADGPLDEPPEGVAERVAEGVADDYGLVRALRAAVARLASGRGLLLVLDDAHRACALTADFLEYLVRCPPDAAVLTVFAHRAGPADRHLTALSYEAPNLHHLRLAPLPDERMRALLPAGADPVAAAVALRDAGGLPGLLDGSGVGAGAQADAGAGGASCGAGGGVYGALEVATGVPPSAGAARGLDLHCLSSLGWRTACAAAVVGDAFLPSVVAATARLPEADVLCGLDALHAEALVAPDADGRRFRFVRPAVRARIHHASGAGWRHAARLRAVAALRAAGETLALAAHLVDADVLTAQDAAVLAEVARETLWRQPDRAARALARAGAVLGDPVAAALLRAQALVLAGRFGAAERLYAATWERLAGGADEAVADAVRWRVRGLRGLGGYAQAQALLDAREGAEGWAGRAERLALAVEGARLGVPAEAGALDRAVRAASGDAGAGPGLAVAALLGAAHALGGASAAAREAADRVERALDAGAAGTDPGGGPAGGATGGAAQAARWADRLEACRWLGETQLCLGMPGRAAVRFERALRAALFLGHGHAIAPLAAGLAHARRECGDEESAQFLGELAAAVSAGHGNSWLLSFANEIAGERKGPSPGRAEKSPLAAASVRETEIAHLVSAGYTNQRIAARLGISTKTVETHMSRIFKKLGVNSRAEVAHAVGRSGSGPGAG